MCALLHRAMPERCCCLHTRITLVHHLCTILCNKQWRTAALAALAVRAAAQQAEATARYEASTPTVTTGTGTGDRYRTTVRPVTDGHDGYPSPGTHHSTSHPLTSLEQLSQKHGL